MKAKRTLFLALFSVLALVAAGSSHALDLGGGKDGNLVVESYRVVGSVVEVKVSAQKGLLNQGTVQVDAQVAGLNVRGFVPVVVVGSSTATVHVGFLGTVDGVIEVGFIDEAANPM